MLNEWTKKMKRNKIMGEVQKWEKKMMQTDFETIGWGGMKCKSFGRSEFRKKEQWYDRKKIRPTEHWKKWRKKMCPPNTEKFEEKKLIPPNIEKKYWPTQVSPSSDVIQRAKICHESFPTNWGLYGTNGTSFVKRAGSSFQPWFLPHDHNCPLKETQNQLFLSIHLQPEFQIMRENWAHWTCCVFWYLCCNFLCFLCFVYFVFCMSGLTHETRPHSFSMCEWWWRAHWRWGGVGDNIPLPTPRHQHPRDNRQQTSVKSPSVPPGYIDLQVGMAFGPNALGGGGDLHMGEVYMHDCKLRGKPSGGYD